MRHPVKGLVRHLSHVKVMITFWLYKNYSLEKSHRISQFDPWFHGKNNGVVHSALDQVTWVQFDLCVTLYSFAAFESCPPIP